MVFLYFTGAVYVSLLLLAVFGIVWSPINTTAVIVVIGLAAWFCRGGQAPRGQARTPVLHETSPIDLLTVVVLA
ncbi:MAG: hypothetical protein ACXWHG_15000, partial [Thermoanaerobaculia bacterium]